MENEIQIVRRVVALQYELLELLAKHRGERLVYPEQHALADELMGGSDCLLTTLVAPPQWGKTGAVLEYVRRLVATQIDPDVVFFLSGMNDKDWADQTKSRLIDHFKPHVFHRGQISKVAGALRGRRNGLIVIDESHIASEAAQTLCRHVQEAGILDIDYLKSHNIRILQVSATPGATLIDGERWGANHRIVRAPLYESYTSFQTLMDQGRVFQSSALKSHEEIAALFTFIKERFTTPRYHIVRMGKNIQEFNLALLHADEFDVEVLRHDSESRITNVDSLVSLEPQRHTIIMIKGFWRASKTLNTQFVGLCHENAAKTKDWNAEIQGLAGRMCGVKPNRDTVIFCDKSVLHRYMEWFKNGCDYRKCQTYRSKSIRVVEGKVKKCAVTLLHPTVVHGLQEAEEEQEQEKITHLVRPSPIRSLGPVSSVPVAVPDGQWLTSIENLTIDEFAERYKLKPSMLANASGVAQKLLQHGIAANVSFKWNSAIKVAALENYFLKPSWAGKPWHAVVLDGTVHLIKRNVELLGSLYTLDKDRFFYGHNERGLVIKYQLT